MSVTAYLQSRWQQSSDFLQTQSTITNDAMIVYSNSIAASGTATISIAYDASQIKAVYVLVDQDGTTLNPTSGTSATLTFTDASVAYQWQTNCQLVNIWNDDFTAILVTNGSSTDAVQVDIRIIYETP